MKDRNSVDTFLFLCEEEKREKIAEQEAEEREDRKEEIKDDFFYEELITHDSKKITDTLMDAGFTDDEEVCEAIESLYLSLPMRDGRRPAAGLERVERKAWAVIEAIRNSHEVDSYLDAVYEHRHL